MLRVEQAKRAKHAHRACAGDLDACATAPLLRNARGRDRVGEAQSSHLPEGPCGLWDCPVPTSAIDQPIDGCVWVASVLHNAESKQLRGNKKGSSVGRLPNNASPTEAAKWIDNSRHTTISIRWCGAARPLHSGCPARSHSVTRVR